jgi:hypothetical protein
MALSHNNTYLQVKYLTMLSSRFRNYKQSGNNKWQFSCPFCGDSKSRSRMARGYVLENDRGGGFYFYCQKCTKSMSLPFFIKTLDPVLYKDYLKEMMITTEIEHKAIPKLPRFQPQATSKGLIKLSKLPPDHPVRVYVRSRLIPAKETYRLFYTDKFKTFVNSNIPDKFDPEKIGGDEARLVMPFVSRDRRLVGLQGRSLDPSVSNAIRYYTIMLDDDAPRIFGLDKIDMNDDILVVEGPIDSLFLDNAIASAGGDIEAGINKSNLDKKQVVIVYDNEPRSITTIKKMMKAIDGGYRICIWPAHIQDKDINDMIKRMVGEHNEELILDKCKLLRLIIMKNVHQGPVAHVKLTQWRKC